MLEFSLENFHFQTLLYDEDVVSYADGIGFHWYSDFISTGNYFRILETKVGNTTKELFRIGTEAANGKLSGFIGFEVTWIFFRMVV